MENNTQQFVDSQVKPVADMSGKAKMSLILGIVGMVAWIIPIVGLPIQITGLVFSVKGLGSAKRGAALAGLVLCVIGLMLTSANAGIGAYMGATGQNAIVNQIMK